MSHLSQLLGTVLLVLGFGWITFARPYLPEHAMKKRDWIFAAMIPSGVILIKLAGR